MRVRALVGMLVGVFLLIPQAACGRAGPVPRSPTEAGRLGGTDQIFVDYFPPPGAPDVAGRDWIAIGETCPVGTSEREILYDAGGVCIRQLPSGNVKVEITTLGHWGVDSLVEYRARKVGAEILLRGFVPKYLSEQQRCDAAWEAPEKMTDLLEASDLRTAGCPP